ncbi:unnamed protein product [Closterium sp. NIES-54]
MFSLTGYGTGDWLTAIPIAPNRRIGPVHFANSVRFRLGLPFSTPKKCDCSDHTPITDPRLPNHLFRCGTGKHRINTHNELRDACVSMAQDAGFIVHSESAAHCPIDEQTADFTMTDCSSGAVYVCDVTITDPISTRDPEAQKGRGWAAREQADKKIQHYANRPETVSFFPLAVETYGCPCAEVPVFLKLLADTAARRHFNADSKSFHAAKFLHQFRQRWSVALQRAQSVGLLLKLGEAAAAENPPGRPVAFDTWHDDLQLYLLSDSRDSVSLFDHVSNAAPAPPAIADVSSGGGGGGSRGSGGSGGGGTNGSRSGPWRGGLGGGWGHQQQRQSETHTAQGDCYWCVPPDPGIAAAALGVSAAGTPPGLHLPSFSTNLVSTAALQDAMVTTTTLGGQRVSIYMCTRTGRHLATFTHRPGSSLYTLATEPPQVAASAQVSVSGQVAASCSCRLLSHQTLLWNHRLGHPNLPRLRGMHSRLLGRERYFLLVVDDYTRYTTIFPLCGKGEVSAVLIPWIRTVRLQLRERFGQDLPVLRLHSDRGGEFSSTLLQDFCRGEGIRQSHGGRSYLHAAAPQFLWPFAVRYAAHQLNLWPRVSLPETSPTVRWTGKVGDASVFRVSGSRTFVCDTSADKLSARAIPCVFLGFVPDTPGWQFYHPTSRRVLPSHDVTFDESVPFYRLFPYRSAPSPPPPLFLAPGRPPVDPLPPQGPAPSGVSQVDPLPSTAPVQVAVVSGAPPGVASGSVASGGAETGGAGSGGGGSGGAEPEGVEPGGAESEGAEPGGAESEGAESGGAEPRGAASSGGPAGASPRVSSQKLREWLVQCAHRRSGAPWAGEPGDTGAGAGARAGVAGVGGPGAGGAGAAGAEAVDPGAGDAGGTPASPLLVPSPYTEQSGGLTERREPASCPISPVRTARRAPRSRPPHVPGTHTMAIRPSSVPLRVPLTAPPESSLLEVPDLESDRSRAARPTVARLLATAVTDLSFESAAASALVAELLDFAAACHLDYAFALDAESVPASPLSVGGECALGTDILEDRHEDFGCLAATVPRFASLLLAPEGDPAAPDIPTPRSYAEAITGTYVDEVPPPGVNIVDGMWIFRVKRPPGSPPAFKARYVARGLSQRQGVDFFHTFSPTPKMTTLRVLLHVVAQRDYELHSLDFSTAFLQGSLHEEIWLHRPPGFTGSFPAGTQWSLRRPVYGPRQAPREWHHTLRTTLAALGNLGLQITRDRARRTITLTQSHMVHQVVQRFGFQYSSPQLTPLSTSHSLSAPPSDESVEPSGPYPELVGCLMYLMTCTRPDLAYPLSLLARYGAPDRHRKGPVVLTGHADASWVDDSATQRSSQGYTFSLGSVLVSWPSTHSSSVLSSSCEAGIYAGAMAAQELRWLTYLLTDLGEQPCSPPVLYVDNKAMIALCHEHKLEHRTKHIALRYFLARELQQRGQLRLAYVATRANTADVFTKALPPGDHQRFITVLCLVPTLPHLLTA